MRHVFEMAVLLFAAAAAGCATTTPLPTEGTTSRIRAAEEVGASKVPQASLHLQLAKEQLVQAEGLAKQGEKEQAVSMLSRAEVDAQLAVALSHEDAQKSEAAAAMERVRKLQRDNK